jgi:hypothetical protein
LLCRFRAMTAMSAITSIFLPVPIANKALTLIAARLLLDFKRFH